jgi:hypothetical protein
VTILESLREMCAAAHEAAGRPAEIEIRMPEPVVRALWRSLKTNEPGVVYSSAGTEPVWIRSFEAWGAIYVRPLEAK